MPINKNGECYMFEKLYLIYNPLNGTKHWVSEREFKIGSQKLKDVFGVLYLEDLKIMLCYNNPFKHAIMEEYNLTYENSISLHHVCRLIRIEELMEIIDKEARNTSQSDKSSDFYYPARVEVQDGFFIWDEEKCCYAEASVKCE